MTEVPFGALPEEKEVLLADSLCLFVNWMASQPLGQEEVLAHQVVSHFTSVVTDLRVGRSVLSQNGVTPAVETILRLVNRLSRVQSITERKQKDFNLSLSLLLFKSNRSK